MGYFLLRLNIGYELIGVFLGHHHIFTLVIYSLQKFFRRIFFELPILWFKSYKHKIKNWLHDLFFVSKKTKKIYSRFMLNNFSYLSISKWGIFNPSRTYQTHYWNSFDTARKFKYLTIVLELGLNRILTKIFFFIISINFDIVGPTGEVVGAKN